MLKNVDVSSRDSKLKSRAFVDYLVDYNSTNIFRIWNLEKEDVNEYRDVIFDESELYDIYKKSDQLAEPQKDKKTMKISINQFINLNSENDEWLEISIKDRLMLKRKRVVELSTSSSKESSQRRSSRNLTFVSSQSFADSFTDYSSLSNSSFLESKIDSKRDSSLMNLTDRILDMRRKREIKKNVISVDLDEANILKEKRIRFVNNKYPKSDYAQLTWQLNWIEEKWDKISEFHVAFMTELMKFDRFLIENQIDFRIDLKEESSITQNQINLHINTKIPNRIYISTLLSSSAHWRAMKRHFHDEEFRKAAQMKFDAINSRDTWKIMNKSSISDHQKIISLKWVFIYKNDSNDYLIKYKARIIVKDDLQHVDSQNVYAATLTSKIFKMLMTLMIAFHLKTRQLDVVNAFLNAHNDELVYCQMFDDYRLDDKCYRIIKALYDQRKSSLLWFRILIIKCLELKLKFISEESCLFTVDDVIMFFYVNDIVFAYRTNRKRIAESYITRLKSMFEMRDMKSIKFFLEIKVIQINSIYLVQNIYIDKLIKDYKININSKTSFIFLSIEDIESFDEDVDQSHIHEYRKKMRSVCYSAVISRSDIVKVASKLTEHLINSESTHLTAMNHLIRYLYDTKHLTIKFDVSKRKELIAKNVFEATADAAFANEKERKSAEKYTFKLFDDLIDWATKKQTTIFTLITEIELLIMLHADKKFIWWLNLFKKIKFSSDSDQQMTLYNNNLQTIRLLISEITKVDTKLRHVDVVQCWLRK